MLAPCALTGQGKVLIHGPVRSILVIFERQNRFGTREVDSMIAGLTSACQQVGMSHTFIESDWILFHL